ncbi:E3 SUMO-protein ligase RanBP2-like isoform X5 [Branchiostoma lanceolatum]|uniref:E3 SUMO-protein ligase RanBP2-like isoform X5 n=1 Tax=Branchiostoma lanceolatum TaxID=7740 RepID=UPI003456752D
MIRSKREVDKHVAKVERNVQNPREKALKGYGIARLYFEAKDYDQARKYLAGYIGVSNNDAKAHRFMGQLWEASQDHSKALGCYKRSLEINPAQKDLVLKVAEVYCSVKDDPQRMQYWADKAGALFPGHPTVFNLKERIMTSQGGSVDDMEDLIGEQMAAHPKDAHLHIRLIKLYQDNDRLEEAYDHCTSVERTRVFKDSAEWYSCMANTLQTYLDQRTPPSPSSDDTHTVYIQLLSALSSLVRLRLAETSISQCSHVLRRFDRCLVTASQLTAPGGGEGGEEWRAVLEEMTGQIYWLAGTLLLKQAQQGQLTWTDAMPLVTACYLVSYQSAAPDTRAPWVTVADPARQLPPPTCWYDMACCRLSQVGHMLESLQVDQGSDWVEDCQLKFCNPQGRERVFYVLFGYGTDNNRSFLLTSDCFTRQDIELPDTDDLIQYDMVAVHDQPGELQPVVWLGLQWFSTEDSIQPDCGLWVSRLFPELQFTTTDLKSGAPLSVCLLDIQAFVYATVYTSTLQLRQENIPYGQMEPRILPLPLSRYLCSQAQRDWWAATYRLYTGTAEMGTLAKQKLTLQRGLEVVRCVGNHGLHANLLVHLAETFAARMGEVQESSEQPWFYKEQWSALQERSAHYWSTVIPLLQRLQQNLTVLTPKDPLFPHLNRDIPGSKISELLEEGRLFLAQTAAQQGKSEEALKMLRTMKTAEAARHMAQIYKFLANKQLEDLEDADEDEEQQKRAEWETLLSKARNCLTLALERLGEDKTNPLYLSIMKEIQAIDEDLGKAHDQLTDQLDGEGSPLFTSSTAGSPPRQQARGDGHSPVLESPSSVAAQLKALTLDNSRLLETCTRSEQRVQELTEQMRFLMDEFKDMKNSSGTPSRSVGQSMSTQTPPDEKTAQPTADASYLPQPGFATPHYGYAQTPPYGYAYTTPLAYGGVQHGFATPTHGYAGYSALQHAMYHSSQVAAASQESATQMLAAATGVTTPARVPAVVPSAVNMTSTPAATASGHDQTPLLRSLIMSTPTNTKPAAAMASDDPQKGPPNQTMRTSDSISLTRASTEPSQPLSVTIPPEHIKSPVYQNQGYSPSMLQASQRSYVHTVVHGPNPTTQFAATSPRAQLQQGMPLTTQNIQGFMQATQPAAFTGLMKPGVATTTLQPGTLQPGTLQPGTLQPGTLQPGMPGYNQAMQAAALRMGLAQGYPQAVSPRAMQIPQAQLAGRPGITTGVPQLSQGGQTIPATQSLPAATSPRGVQMGVHSRLGVVGGIPVSSQALSAAAAAGGFFSFSTASQMPGTELSGIATKYPILTTMVNPNTFQSTPTFTVPRSLTPQFGEYSDQSKSQSDEEEVSTPDSEEPSETNIQIGPGYFRPPGESPITFAPIIGEGEQSSDLTKSPSKELFVTGEERMFQRPEEVDRENQELASDEDTEAHDDGIHFEPIVTLPDEVELKTGEEDEDELFVHRAKLFRFDKDNHQWKERGLGNIKVLKNRHNQRCRILMRRDQVLKICCNHYITADMAMKPNAGSNRSWVWVAMDFAEEGGTKEQFAVRFKEAETALEFKNRVDEAIQIITSMPATSSKKSPAKQASPVKEPPSPAKPLSPKKPPSPTKTKDQEVPVAFGQPSEPTMSFRDMFKPKPGSWDCPACMISNTGDKDACVACMTQKPGTSLKPSEPTMSFGDMFKPKPGSWDCPTCMVSNTGDKDACLACTTPKPGTAPKPTKPGFSFGAMFSQDAASQPTVPFGATGAAAKPGVGTVSQSGFSFVSTGQSGFGFGTSQQTAETTQPKTGFSFGFAVPETSTTSQTTALTGFQFKPTQPETSDSAQSGGFSFKLDQSQPSQSGFGLNFGQSQPSAPNQSGFKFALSQSQPSEGSQPATGTEGSKFTFGDVKEKAPTDLSQRSPEKAGQLSTMTLGPTLTSDPSVEIIYEKEPSAKQLTRALTYRLPPTFYFYEDLPAPEGYRPDEDFDDYEIWFDQWKAGKALRKDAPQPAQKTSTPTKTTPSRSTTDGTIQGATGGQEPTGGASTDMFGNTSVASLSFASLATTDGGFAFGKTDSFKPFSFAGAGATLFGGASSQDAHGDDDHVPENHDIHFEPIVSLPKVEVRTGEEDEAVVYSQRSRLYRWDKDTSQWKERGLGEMKILQHKQETRFRSVMRREQVLKVCCNHLIKPDMDLKPNAGSDRSWVWSAMDYSEEPKFEQFAIKFKTIELAQVYKDKVEECKAILAEAERTSGVPASSESSPVKVNRQDTLASQTPETSPVKENRQQASAPQTPEVLEKSETESPEKSPAKGFGDLFKTKPGSWDCEVCMVNNPGEKAKCLACSTPKPGMSAASSTADGGSKSLSALFKPKVDTWDCSVCMVNNPADKTACLACSTPKPGTNVQAATATSSSGISGTGFIFKQPGTASASFGGVDTATVTSSSGIPGSGFSFKQPGTASASFGGVDTATVTSSSGIPGSGFSFKQPGTASTSFGGFNLSNPSGSTFGQPAASSGSVFGKASSGTGVGFTFGSPAKPAESTGFVFGGPSTASQPATGTGFSFGLKADETAFNTSSPFFSQPGKEMPSIGDLAKQSLLGAETGAKPLSFADALKQKATDFALGGQDSSSGTTPPSTLFGDTSSTTDTSATSLSFKEMANQAGGFKFTFSPEKIIPASKASAKSPLKSPIRSPKKDDGDFYESDGGEDIHFEPIVKLPEKIELKTGEEEEEQLFKFRAKLFRWDADLNQWKERGIGDIKILRHKTTNRSRVLMRREQVLKLCANHLITGAMSLHPNSGSDRSWVWTAVDAAEDEPKPEQFAVRFKLPETAAEFKTYFDQCVETAKMYSSPTKGTSGQNPPDDSPAAGAAASPKTPIRSCDPKLSATLQDIETEIADAIKEDDDNDNHGGTNESNQSGNVSSSDNAESEGFTLVSSPEQTTHSDGC